MDVNDTQLSARDAAKIMSGDYQPTALKLVALEGGAHFMVIEMAASDER